jgi:hypothetical protein
MGAFVAIADDATAAWWNPAGLATGRLFSLVVERGKTDDPGQAPVLGPSRRDASSGFSISFPSLALSYYRLRVSEVSPETPGAGDALLRALAVSQYGMTVGQSLGSHLVIGTTLCLVKAGTATSTVIGATELLDRTADLSVGSETKTDLDLGALVALGAARFGVSVKHLRAPEFSAGGSQFTMKRQARAGVGLVKSLRGPVEAITLAADADLTRTPTVNRDVRRAAGGLEIWLKGRRLGLRSGVSTNTVGEQRTSGTAGISIGGPSKTALEAAIVYGRDHARNGLNIGISMTF